MATKASEYTNNIVGQPSTAKANVRGQGTNMTKVNRGSITPNRSGMDKLGSKHNSIHR